MRFSKNCYERREKRVSKILKLYDNNQQLVFLGVFLKKVLGGLFVLALEKKFQGDVDVWELVFC
jgi:hypothetical protein